MATAPPIKPPSPYSVAPQDRLLSSAEQQLYDDIVAACGNLTVALNALPLGRYCDLTHMALGKVKECAKFAILSHS